MSVVETVGNVMIAISVGGIVLGAASWLFIIIRDVIKSEREARKNG